MKGKERPRESEKGQRSFRVFVKGQESRKSVGKIKNGSQVRLKREETVK